MIKRTPARLYISLVKRLFPDIVDFIERAIGFIERGLYGWSKRDCWAADIYLVRMMIDMIKWLKKNKMGIPHDFVMKAAELKIADQDTDMVDVAVVLYNNTLDEIVDGLEAYLQMMDLDWQPGEDIRIVIKSANEAKRKFRKSMILLVRYFSSLGV